MDFRSGLKKDRIDFPEDGCVDNIHPNDLGIQAYAGAYEKIIREILSMPAGHLKTTKPVSQRREPHMYEWKERHNNILRNIQLKHPKRVIIGNSITHYWGGTTERESGSQSWRKQMAPAGYRLLLESGKINETLFSDGLHPNEEGYVKIVDDIVE